MEPVVKLENIKSLLLGVPFTLWLYWVLQRRNLYRFASQFPREWGVPLFGILHKITHLNLDEWYRNRKLINPSFNHTMLINLFPIFNKTKSLTLLKLEALVGKGENKLQDILQRIMLGLVFETTMGKIMKRGEEVNEDMAKKYQYIAKHTMIQSLLGSFNLDSLFKLNYHYWQLRQYMFKTTDEFIHQKIIGKQQSNSNLWKETLKSDSSDVGIRKTSKIFIDQAIQLYEDKKFTWNDIQSESNTLIAAGFETTANSTFAALVMLAMHPDVQEKLYQEIVSVFPDKDFEMEYSHIENLPYLDMFIKEVLRLNPAIPLIGRHVVNDTQLSKDILLPKDLQILIPIFHLHRSTDIWGPNAEQFNPDNFLPENIQGKHPFAYIPFSKGSRNCIGWRYGVFSMKVLLAGCIRNYRLTTSFRYEDLRYMIKVALIYINEPDLEVHRR